MIGLVTPDYQAIIRITIYGHDSEIRLELEALIDTGFNGFLSLHPAIISQLTLPQTDIRAVELADGSLIETKIYRANVSWPDPNHVVEVMEITGDNVIGMLLLRDHELHIEVRDGGIVEINPLRN